VQEVVDKLHISRIEIREAEAPEIAKYMFKKVRESCAARGRGVDVDVHLARVPARVEHLPPRHRIGRQDGKLGQQHDRDHGPSCQDRSIDRGDTYAFESLGDAKDQTLHRPHSDAEVSA
jgi:hypothetical protein